MKKILVFLLSAVLLVPCIALAVSAGTFETDVAGTQYEVLTTPEITFSYRATAAMEELKPGSAVTLVPRGGCTIEALADGDLVSNATGFSDKGIITVENSVVRIVGQNAGGVCEMADEDIPTFSFSMDFGEEVTFDTAYMALYHEIAACIAIPGEKKVIVETSKDGTTYVPVDSGVYYFNSTVGDYDGPGDQGVDECPVYLGKKVTYRYVRFTYTFRRILALLYECSRLDGLYRDRRRELQIRQKTGRVLGERRGGSDRSQRLLDRRRRRQCDHLRFHREKCGHHDI